MLLRLIKDKDKYFMLFQSGHIQEIKSEQIYDLLSDFRSFSLQVPLTNRTFEGNIENYEADTIAYINDNRELCIVDMEPFKQFIIDSDKNIDNLLSASEYAERVGRTKRQVLFHLTDDRIPGAIKFGRDWFIPKSSVEKYPDDNRIVSGKYVKRR